MAKRTSLRASDADRDRVADRLRVAATEGRLHAHEFEDRLATALRAQTYGELDSVVSDLPGAPLARGGSEPRGRALELAIAQPIALAAVLVLVAVLAFVLAAVVVAGMFAFSGIWLIVAFVLLARRGGPHRRFAHRGPRL